MIQFQKYFQSEYPGFASFIETIIKPIFGESFHPNKDLEEMIEYREELGDFDKISNNLDDDFKERAEESGLEQLLELGTIHVQGDTRPIYIYDITVSNRRQLSRNRKGIQDLVARTLNNQSGAFMIFHYKDETWEWRFSYKYVGKDRKDTTDSKRFTYLLGRDQVCKTAAQRFENLLQKKGKIVFDDITEAFSVEKVSKEFFEKYKLHYGRFVAHVIGKEYINKGEGKGEWQAKEGLQPSELFYGLNEDEKVVRDYVKKLLGRIVFLHFLQKKGWLGATDEEWTNGPQDFMYQLFDKASTEQKNSFLDAVLEPLYSCLDVPMYQRNVVYDTKVEGLRSVRVPFLGGLFERNEEDKAISIFPQKLFADLFEFLSEYNFTIDENDPNDAQVGVDPEMLGRIFENLLEDNKDKGAFYTPKEIVQYMCRESLIAYLQTDVNDEQTKDDIRQFVTTYNASVLSDDLKEIVDQKLKDVKICDPAIGSGAFPMGLLRELYACRKAIEGIDDESAVSIKTHIIQSNIYGVDIEKGAVDIARLRFWLALIVDEKTPHALPNLDYKIMQGNSLITTFNGKYIDLDTKAYNKNVNPLREKEKELNNYIHQFYDSHDSKKYELTVKIKISILSLISIKLNNDIVAWKDKNRNQSTIDLGDNVDTLKNNKDPFPQEKQNLLNYANALLEKFNDENITIEERASININFFDWQIMFSDVFDKGGFDIVIGNPPYVEAKKLKHIASTLKPLFNVYSGTADLSIYFVEHGKNLLATNGILSYITTNKFFNTGYGKPLRKLIISNEINKMINFEQVEVFEGVLVSSVILEMRKTESNNSDFTYEKFYKLNATQFKEQFVSRLGSFGTYPSSELDENEWSFSDVISLKIKKHIERGHKLLGDTEGVNIHRGVTTGCNPAFIIDNAKRDELIAEDSKNTTIIKNMLQGRNIRKWYYNESDQYLVQTGFDLDIPSLYPKVYEHLNSYYGEMVARSDQGKNWWNLRACQYYGEFEKSEKIIWGLTAHKWAFTLDTEGHYLPSNGYILTSTKIPTKYILGLLNSKLLQYYFGFIGVMTAGGAYTLKDTTISALPFVDTDNYEPIISLVDIILSAKKANPLADTTAEEREIDRLVYDLYGLTEDEIAIVEGGKE